MCRYVSETVPAIREYSTKIDDIDIYKPRFARPAVEEFTWILCCTEMTENEKKLWNIARKLRK